jgi:hypothetical protein
VNLRILPSLLAIVVAAQSLAMATRALPDFSGRWTTASDPTAPAPARGQAGGAVPGGGAGAARGGPAGDMGSGWGPTITVTQDAARLTVEYAFFARGDMQPPMKFVYALDGSETTNTVMMGRGIQAQRSRTEWNGEKLVITTVHTFPDPASGKTVTTEVKQILSLESPASLGVETIRSGALGGQPTTSRTVYRKL